MVAPVIRQREVEMAHEIIDLSRSEQSGIEAAQHQIQPRGLLQFLRRIDRSIQARAGHDRPMVGEQDGRVAPARPRMAPATSIISRPVIGYQRRAPSFMTYRRSSAARRRKDRSPAASRSPPNASNGDERSPERPHACHTRRCATALPSSAVTGEMTPVTVETRQLFRVEKAERGIGRRHK